MDIVWGGVFAECDPERGRDRPPYTGQLFRNRGKSFELALDESFCVPNLVGRRRVSVEKFFRDTDCSDIETSESL